MIRKLKKIILILGDLIVLNLSLALSLFFRYQKIEFLERWNGHFPYFLVVFAIFIIILYINGLYNLNLQTNHKNFLKSLFNTAFFGGLISALYFYLNDDAQIMPKTNLFIFVLCFIIIFFLWRLVYQYFDKTFLPKINLAIIGYNQNSAEILKELIKNPGSNYQASLIINRPEDLDSLDEKIKEKNIKALIVCDNFGENEKIRKSLFTCLRHKLTFFNYSDLYEILTNKIPAEAIDQNWIIENFKNEEKKYFELVKRYVDLFFSGIILLLSLPFWPLIALFIKLSSRGPILFFQARLTKTGQEFKIIKFRTMHTSNNDLSPTKESDARVFRFGSFLRKTRLDEIPQLINILKNEMSFIGPRPERPEIIKDLEKDIPFYRTRLLIKPGLSGWDQISGRYHSASLEDSIEKFQYDMFYLKHRSLYLDFKIALKTLATVISRKGI